MGGEPFANDHLLLIAARERFDRLTPAKGFALQAFGVAVSQLPLPRRIEHAARIQLTQLRQADVLGDTHFNDCPLFLPFFRHADNTGANCIGGLMKMNGPSVEADLTVRRPGNAGQRLHQFGTPRAHQSVEAEDLPFSQGEINVSKFGGMTEIFHLQHRLAFLTGHFREGLGNGASHHHGDHPLFANLMDVAGTDKRAVAQNGVVVRQLKDFIKLVRDKQNRFAFLLQALNDLIKLQNFVL